MRSLSVLKNLPADPGFTDKRNGAQNQFENSDFLISAQKKHIFSMLAISKYVYVYIYIFFFFLILILATPSDIWDLSSHPGIKPRPSVVEGRVLTTGPLRKSLGKDFF